MGSDVESRPDKYFLQDLKGKAAQRRDYTTMLLNETRRLANFVSGHCLPPAIRMPSTNPLIQLLLELRDCQLGIRNGLLHENDIGFRWGCVCLEETRSWW